jgi:AmmeMemoRadiSam system protein A
MNREFEEKLIQLCRWVLERWAAEETWRSGGPGLGPAEDHPVDGLFVTLMIGGNLRGCIGTLARQDSLDTALRQMTVQAAGEDPRFPPVRSEETSQIKLGISILLPARTLDDIDEIVIGRDGLIIEMDGSRGLFLPEVATDWGWDRHRFLDELCGKAGLPAGSWRDPRCRLFRFETLKITESPDS